MPGEAGPGLGVVIDLTDQTLTLRSQTGEIGHWSMGEIRVNALPDGFHLRAEGEEVILDIADDAEFAVALNLTSAPPLLRRKMSALLRARPAEE
jgi:hypothetical protein